MHSFRSFAIFLCACLPFSVYAAAPPSGTPAPAAANPDSQSAPAAPATVLHANTNLVLVDVVVTDHGNAVHGLDRRRFHIFEDGREQAITAFDEHQPAPAPAVLPTPPALPPNTYSNIPTYPQATAVNVLLLDALNTPLSNQLDVRRQMIEYLGKIPKGTTMAVFTLGSHLRMIEGFTTDVALLSKAIEGKKEGSQASDVLDSESGSGMDQVMAGAAAEAGATNPHGGPTARAAMAAMALAAMQQFAAETTSFETDLRVKMTLQAMQQLARYLSAIPGRKNLIWFSGSFPLALTPDASLNSPFTIMRNYADEVRNTNDLLSSARVAVYPVDGRGLMTNPSMQASGMGPGPTGLGGVSTGVVNTDPHIPVSSTARFSQQTEAEQSAMKQIAEETGGRAYVDTNGLKEAVESAVENGASYYTIGYAPASGKFDGQFRKIEVRVDDSSDKLAYRRGYYADPPDRPSVHDAGVPGVMNAATLLGAPPATQIVFLARVLPSTDPQFKNVNFPAGPEGSMSASLKGPVRRYIVDLTIDPHMIDFAQAAGVHRAQLEFVMTAYDPDDVLVNYMDRSIQVSLPDERYSHVMAMGMAVRLALDVPVGRFALRIAVHDLTADRAGSLQIPLYVAAK